MESDRGAGPRLEYQPQASLALAWPAVDLTLYKALNGFANRHDDFEDVLRLFAVYAQYFFVALLGALFLARGKWRSLNARHGVIAAGFAALLALGAADLISHIWARPRPYVAHPADAHLFIPASGDPSFPSDHAVGGFALAFGIWLYDRTLGGALLVLATMLALARVVVGTHYPGDVLAGAVIGAASAGLLFAVPVTRRMLARLAERAGALRDRLPARA